MFQIRISILKKDFMPQSTGNVLIDAEIKRESASFSLKLETCLQSLMAFNEQLG